MKLNVYSPSDLTSLRLFDFYYAYSQAQNRNQNYSTELEINITNQLVLDPTAINIAVVYMPTTTVDDIIKQFDVVLFDNQHHPIEICTDIIYNNLHHDNCYLIAGACLTEDYPVYDKIVYLDLDVSADYLTQGIYPQYFEKHKFQNNVNRQSMIYINGQNRTSRQFFMEMLDTAIPTRNTWPEISKTLTSFFEDEYDTAFREEMNTRYVWKDNTSEWSQNQYYAKSIDLGTSGKFGKLAPGYFMLDDYFDYHCVIFAETCWINNQAFKSEKIGKCFGGRSIPWPVGGANLNALYLKMGYQTAWNLLPDVLKSYDAELDHKVRYQKCAEAIHWAHQHPEIWQSAEAKNIVAHNAMAYYSKHNNIQGIEKLNTLLTETHNRKFA